MLATKAIPKELIPIVDKLLIQYAVEEASAAGIDTLIFVTRRHKRAIDDCFDTNPELEMALRAKSKDEQAEMVAEGHKTARRSKLLREQGLELSVYLEN